MNRLSSFAQGVADALSLAWNIKENRLHQMLLRIEQEAYEAGFRAKPGEIPRLSVEIRQNPAETAPQPVIPEDHESGKSDPAGSSPLRDASKLKPLSGAELQTFRALEKALPKDPFMGAVGVRKIAADLGNVPLSSVSAYLCTLRRKRYINRIGRAMYEIAATGNPRLTNTSQQMQAGGCNVHEATRIINAKGQSARPAPPTRNRQPFRRFTDVPLPDPENVLALDRLDPAMLEMRTKFPTTVVNPEQSPRLLVSGGNSRKLGDRIVKGAWAGFPIYQLTLEERATCPKTCELLTTCYGNAMHLARRHRNTDKLGPLLHKEVHALGKLHKNGFAVRLHTLGDFPDAAYVNLWRILLEQVPQLHAFGYTHWPRESEIGLAIGVLTQKHWDRFAIRFSSTAPAKQGTVTIWRKPEGATVIEGIVCPAETGATACCGTCGLCWAEAARDKTIVFVGHGPKPPWSNGKRAGEKSSFGAPRRSLPDGARDLPNQTHFVSKTTQNGSSVLPKPLPDSATLSPAVRAILDKPAPPPCPNPVKISMPVVRRVDETSPPPPRPRVDPAAEENELPPVRRIGEIIPEIVDVGASAQPVRPRRTGVNEAGTNRGDPEPGHSAADQALNAKTYLTLKGHTVALAIGGLRIDGRLHDSEQVLDLVNKHRTKADLPSLASVTMG